MIEIYICIMFFVASFAKKSDIAATFLFSLVTALSVVAGDYTMDDYYYIVAALFDFLIIYALSGIEKTDLSRWLQIASCISMLANFLGYVAYLNYNAPNAYNIFYFLYYPVIIFLMLGGSDGVGRIRKAIYSARLSCYFFKLSINNFEITK